MEYCVKRAAEFHLAGEKGVKGPRAETKLRLRFSLPLGARVIPGGLFISKQTPAPPRRPTRKKPGSRCPRISLWGLDTELPEYLTSASRPVKDHFGLCSSITSARLHSLLRWPDLLGTGP